MFLEEALLRMADAETIDELIYNKNSQVLNQQVGITKLRPLLPP